MIGWEKVPRELKDHHGLIKQRHALTNVSAR